MRRLSRRDLAALAALLFAGLAWVLWAGKDLSWDVTNHHVYLPFSLLSGRFALDYFAAGPQSYQNPLGYLPFYWLVHQGVGGWGAALLLYLLHAPVIVALYGLACRFWLQPEAWRQRCLATASGLAAPVFMQQLGTSSHDPIGAALVMTGLLGIMGRERIDARGALIAGFMIGCACALKPSAAVFAISALCVLFVQWIQGRCARHVFAAYAAGGTVAFVLLAGGWAWYLLQEFANPFFPLYNGIFKSPYGPAGSLVSDRFLSQSLAGYFSRAYEIVALKKFTYTESFVPDLRPAVLLSAGLCASVIALRSGLSRLQVWLRESRDSDLFVFVCSAWFVWMATSGNGRYAIPLFMLLGLAMFKVLERIFSLERAFGACLLVVVLQLGYYLSAGEYRLVRAAWSSAPYYSAELPERLRQEPFLHLSIGVQTHSAAAEFLHPDGRLVNVVGQLSVDEGGLAGIRLDRLMRAWAGRIRVLTSDERVPDGEQMQQTRNKFSSILYRFRLDVDWSDCLALSIGAEDRHLMSCALKPRSRASSLIESTRAPGALVFETLERQCPLLFSPPDGVMNRGMSGWHKFYPNSDVRVEVRDSGDVVMSHDRVPTDLMLGRSGVVSKEGTDFPCKKLSLLAPE